MTENPFQRLAPELIQCIASCMHPNYVAELKLTCREVAKELRGQYRNIQLRGEPRTLKRFDSSDISIATASKSWPGAAFVAHWGCPEPWRALSRWQRHQLLCLAASSHHPPSLDAALAHCGTVIEADALVSAITAGDLAACRRLFETEGCDWDHMRVLKAAGHSGTLPVCEWLADTVPGPNFYDYIIQEACYAGHEHVVEWALERMAGEGDDRGCSCGWLAAAAAGGQVQLLQRLAARFPLEPEAYVDDESYELDAVAFGCPLAVLQQYCKLWGAVRRWEKGSGKLNVLLSAAASPTPDWEAKCNWLWARWARRARRARWARRGAAILSVDAALGIDEGRLADLLQRPDSLRRLQVLASRGLGDVIELETLKAAGAIGSIAAVEVYLDQRLALLQQAAAAVAAAGGRVWGGQPAEELEVMDVIAMEAAARGHVPVLRLLWERGFVFEAEEFLEMLQSWVWRSPGRHERCESLRYLLLEEPEAVEQGGDAEDWSSVLRDAAVNGADLPLLQLLHEQCDAAIDLAAVAEGGSEEALEWAVAALEAAEGQAPKPLPLSAFKSVLKSGNWAAADWLMRRGLVAASRQEVLESLLLAEGDNRARIVELQWVMGVRSGQAQQAQQVRWTAELHAALVQLHVEYTTAQRCDAPRRVQWLAGLVEEVGAALGGAAGGV